MVFGSSLAFYGVSTPLSNNFNHHSATFWGIVPLISLTCLHHFIYKVIFLHRHAFLHPTIARGTMCGIFFPSPELHLPAHYLYHTHRHLWVLWKADAKMGLDFLEIKEEGKVGRELEEASGVIWPWCKSDPYGGGRKGESMDRISLRMQWSSRKFHQDQWEVFKSKQLCQERATCLRIESTLAFLLSSVAVFGQFYGNWYYCISLEMVFRARWLGTLTQSLCRQKFERTIPIAAMDRDPESFYLEDLSFFTVFFFF